MRKTFLKTNIIKSNYFYNQFKIFKNFSDKIRHRKITLPSLSPSMENGGITEWFKKEGDKFDPGDALAGIETDKAIVDFETNDEGYIAKILYPAGSQNIPLGEVIAITVENEEDISHFKDFKLNAETNTEVEKTQPSNEKKKSNLDLSKIRHRKITLPSLSPSMETGAISEWMKNEGDKFDPGDSLAGIETDKATVDFETNDEGYIAKILKPAGTKNIPLGEVIAITVENEEDIILFKDYIHEEENKTEEVKQESKKIEEEKKTESKTENTKTSNISNTEPIPIISNNTKKNPLSTNVISSTGSYEDIPISKVRKVIAERLVFSKTTIPHFYLNTECNVDKLIKLRQILNKSSQVKISFNDLIIKAVSIACLKVPEVNSSWLDKSNSIRMNNQVDVSVAVQTDNGLITPIVFDSGCKRLGEISADVKNLAKKAKEGKLKPKEYQGGTFTVSNLGMMGISSFSAIINPGQSCILAVGTTEKKVILKEDFQEENLEQYKLDLANKSDLSKYYKVVNVMNSTLSCDHRTVDGAVGARWVREYRNLLENPELMLL